MVQGIRSVIYPVKDITKAKALYTELLGIEPYFDQPFYVGYRVGDQEIGLDPNGFAEGMNSPIAYWHVKDIKKSLDSFTTTGTQPLQNIRDVGGGMLLASVKDTDGNVIGLIQLSS